MSYFVTGATGFIGRFLVSELVDHRDGPIHVLVRESSLPRLEAMIQRWGSDRVIPVIGDLGSPGLGVDTEDEDLARRARSTTSSISRRATT